MRKGIVCSLLTYLTCTSVLWASGTFTNLDFESANVSNLPPNQFEFISVTNGLPGWTAYVGTDELTQVSHNAISLGAANVGISGPAYTFPPLQGTYTAILQSGVSGGQGEQPVSIAQTGLIPVWAKSVQFLASLGYTNDLIVSVGGESTPVVPLGSGSFGCDVSTFAGSVDELKFTIAANAQGGDLNFLDAITFSTQAIPEPGGLSLLAIGVVALGIWRLTRPKAA